MPIFHQSTWVEKYAKILFFLTKKYYKILLYQGFSLVFPFDLHCSRADC